MSLYFFRGVRLYYATELSTITRFHIYLASAEILTGEMAQPCLSFSKVFSSFVFISFMDVTCISNNFNPYMEAILLFWSDLILSQILEIKLISTLTHHNLICSCKLDGEMENIHSIFRNNGYPEYVVKCTIEQRVKSFKYPTYVWSQVVSGVSDICRCWGRVTRYWLI